MKFMDFLNEQLDPKDFQAEINTIKARLDQMVQQVQTTEDEKKKLQIQNLQLQKTLKQQLSLSQKKPKFERQGVATTRSIAKPEATETT
tara:strand:- start:703 stop:969 length:267 start_codon:yes stop_codon:yes gene_type:complete